MSHAKCEDCKREMTPGGGCTMTHVAKSEKGEEVLRITCGGPGDWGDECPGGNCGDCNADPGQIHHVGCDIERCPGCGGQMLGCLGPPDEEFGGCGWLYLSRREVVKT